ncbi:prepilin-type cleavage/methylation-like protein [Shewanella halifaxensis HAW-EB4]|uniref:Prepilin-type cleavage/methylation-like protein n=1 Tax=Shewanella halifaxensis (strain HAW-EB4) TaxID=458817 RepID=B0TJB4_SHEHH|nr:PilW family protein [Shewanella halifaxensis]ABZ75705.1 prepilin-type cleavage/methylation-like protein [Shewanella halifaxensis HAW-EB4]
MKHFAKNSPSIQYGMSLVELMVAMVISLFLSAGILTMFSMSSSNVTTTSQFNQLQENGRIALTIMERDISQLGFMGDLTGTDFVVGVNTTVDSALAAADDCIGAGLNNATLPNNQPAHFRRLWGYESGLSTDSLSCLTGVKERTDVIQIKRFIGPSVAAGINTGYYVSTTASQAIFFNDGTPSSNLLNARIWEYQQHVYYIDEANGIPMLNRKTLSVTGMKNDEQLVEGIENIRFLYGFDNDGDSTPERYIPAESVTSLMWDNESFQRLVAIKIYVLVRSTEQDKSYTNETLYKLGDKTIAAPKDNYRRKIMSTTVVLENPVLIRS